MARGRSDQGAIKQFGPRRHPHRRDTGDSTLGCPRDPPAISTLRSTKLFGTMNVTRPSPRPPSHSATDSSSRFPRLAALPVQGLRLCLLRGEIPSRLMKSFAAGVRAIRAVRPQSSSTSFSTQAVAVTRPHGQAASIMTTRRHTNCRRIKKDLMADECGNPAKAPTALVADSKRRARQRSATALSAIERSGKGKRIPRPRRRAPRPVHITRVRTLRRRRRRDGAFNHRVKVGSSNPTAKTIWKGSGRFSVWNPLERRCW